MKHKIQALKRQATLVILNLIAIPVTGYLTYMHFDEEASDFCNFGASFDCDIVNKSPWSELFGIPVAILGLITYMILLFFAIRGLCKDQSKLIPYLTLFVAGGVAFSLYLTYIEAFVLETFCIFCVIQQIIILIQLVIYASLWKLTKKS